VCHAGGAGELGGRIGNGAGDAEDYFTFVLEVS